MTESPVRIIPVETEPTLNTEWNQVRWIESMTGTTSNFAVSQYTQSSDFFSANGAKELKENLELCYKDYD